MKAYIAAGWFSDEQEKARQDLLEACRITKLKVYSPKDDMLYSPEIGNTFSPTEVFNENIIRIINADFVLASTAGKDMGTLFECGVAYMSNVPIVYYYTGKGKFNLMLAESARIVLSDIFSLLNYLSIVVGTNKLETGVFKGAVE